MTWIADPAFVAGAPFGPQTLPYGVADGIGVVVRVGDHALALRDISGLFGQRIGELVRASSLDPLLATNRATWDELRTKLTEIVTAENAPAGAKLLPISEVNSLLPFTVADYVDFYSSRHHAANVGRILRPNSEPLLPNWTHLPVGYHGRAGTVVVSGTEIVRPKGQRKGDNGPVFGPSERLDIEAEVGFVCGGRVSTEVSTSDVAEHVFGVALVNDWSARDIQAWEYQPLGPFLGKSFATSISAWITPLAALENARIPVLDHAHSRLDYLKETDSWGLDISLEIAWNGRIVSVPPFSEMSYSCAQQLAHMTVNGATVRPGDLFASGTVSGAEKEQRGSFLELSWGGKDPVKLAGGETRTFLEDGDTVVITATAPGPAGSVVGFGEVAGTIAGAREPG